MQLTQNQIDLFEAIEKSSVNDVKSLINNGVHVINIDDLFYYILQKLEELHSQFSNFWGKLSDKIKVQPIFYNSLRYAILS